MSTGTTARRISAAVLVVLAGVGLVVASAGWWLERSFLSTDRFTDTADAILDQPEVQAELTAVLVRQLSREAGADLQIAQPFLATIVEQVVESDLFRGVFDRALSTAHRVLVDRDTRTIVLDLTAAYDQIKGPLEQVAPNLAAQLPSKQELDVVLLHRTQLTTAWDVIDAVKRVVVVLTIGSLVLLAVAIAIATERWRTLARAGWTVLASSVVLLLALLAGRIVLVRQTDDGVLADALGAAYRVIVTPLVVQSVLIAAVGAAGALFARYTATHGLVTWRQTARDGWRWLGGVVPGADGVPIAVGGLRLPAPRVNTRATRVMRAVALLAVGLFAVLEPEAITDLVAVGIGLALLYLAVIEGIAAWQAPTARESHESAS